MIKYIKKEDFIVNLLFQTIFWITIIVISAILFLTPFNLVEHYKNLKIMDIQNYNELVPAAMSDFLGLLFLLLIGAIYYHISSNSLESFKSILNNDFSKSFYDLKQGIKKFILITSVNIAFIYLNDLILIMLGVNIILCHLLNSYFFKSKSEYYYIIILILNYLLISSIPLNYLFIPTYLLILFIFNYLLIINFRNKRKINFILLYLLSFILSIFILGLDLITTNLINLLIVVIFSFQLVPLIYALIYLFKLTFTYLKKVPLAEYTAATYAKQNTTNKVILDFMINGCKYFANISISEINKVLNKNYFALDKKKDFARLLDNLKLTNESYNEIFNFYCLTPLPYKQIKQNKTENVKFRNKSNLLISMGILILFVIFYLVFRYYCGVPFSNLFLKVAFIFIFIRLTLRSIEICFAFYNDIKPSIKTKGTYLSGSERITLAIKSIIELIILSTLLYTIHESLSIYHNSYIEFLLKFSNVLPTSFLNAVAISIFNISFEHTITFTNFEIFIALTHLIQIISSVTLISISIASYLNLPKQNFEYEINITNNKFILSTKPYGTAKFLTKITKEIASGDNIDELLKNLNKMFQNNKISNTQLEEVYEYINIVYFKL